VNNDLKIHANGKLEVSACKKFDLPFLSGEKTDIKLKYKSGALGKQGGDVGLTFSNEF